MEKIKMNCDVLRSRYAHALAGSLLAALGLAMFVGPIPAHADGFPFGHELLLDASPMRGSKKVPMLDIGDAGTAEIELWCNSVKAQLVVAGATITIITGEPSARQCAPDRARADDDLPRRAQRRHQLANGTLRPGAHGKPHPALPPGVELKPAQP
jgi:hypothetical protein